jgi:nicotinamide-nucleotide amidase
LLENDISQLLNQYHSRTGTTLTIGTVESATGGRIGDRITNVPGSSTYYMGSIIAYCNDVKTDIVGVKTKTIEAYGAVSPETAKEMAEGGRKLLKTDICLSDTGIAGPGGDTSEKPVGLFYIGLSIKDNTIVKKHYFHGSREENKQEATDAVLKLLKEFLSKSISQLENSGLDEKHVVTCFLEHNGKILILKRSKMVGSYRERWAGVSGYLETNAIEQAYLEIKEETGLNRNEIELLKKGEPFDVMDNNIKRIWIIHPFLFHISEPEKIKIDWEHTELKWIDPQELTSYETVPSLNDALSKVI